MRLSKAVKASITNSWVQEKWIVKLRKALEDFNGEILLEAENQIAPLVKLYQDNIEIKTYLIRKNYLDSYAVKDAVRPCTYVNKISGNINCSYFLHTTSYSCRNFDHKTKEAVAAISKFNSTICEFDSELSSIETVINSVTTVKALHKALPGIESYTPTESDCTSLISAEALAKAQQAI